MGPSRAAVDEWAQELSLLPGRLGVAAIRQMMERAEEAPRESARRLRAVGHDDAAERAAREARRLRLSLDYPRATRALYAMTARVDGAAGVSVLATRALRAAISFTRADFGNVQLMDRESGGLRIVAQRGFGPDFLNYFAIVGDDASACGRAAKTAVQTVITNVALDDGFAPHRAIAEASGFRAVQSTPLVDARGRALGALSTHYRRPRHLLEGERSVLQLFGERVGAALDQRGALDVRFARTQRPIDV